MLSLIFFGWLGLISCVVSDSNQRLLVDQLRWDFLELENELWNFTSNELIYRSQEESELYLKKKFYDFDQKLKQMPEDVLLGLKPIQTIPEFLFLFSEMKIIENKYEKFREYQVDYLTDSKNKIMMEDMIYDITNNRTGVNQSINTIDSLSFQGKSIIGEMNKIFLKNFWCKNYDQSPQQIFYNFYNVIALNELKGYVMQQFAHLGNRLWDKGQNAELSASLRETYETKFRRILTTLRSAMKLPRNIWKCDPETFVKGRTYDEFTRLLQGHIQNEVDMNYRGTCRRTCSEYSYTKSYGCYDYQSEFCRKVERCGGNLIGCHFVESHAHICLASDPSRRYDYVRYNSGKTMGKKHYCSNEKSINSWTRWFVRCHYCMCLCDEHGPKSDRYINLRDVMADIKNNRVVTGLRLVKRNRLLHIQIQEGKLLPYGYIDPSTIRWVPVDNYKITDAGVKNEADYFTLVYDKRSMVLDEIQVNENNHIMTGCRFGVHNNRVHFEIYVNPFDWYNGTVLSNGGYYIYETNSNPRKISLSSADVPIYTSTPSQKYDSHNPYYIEFTHTDFSKDAAQTTIPFIDTQDVVSNPAVPLIGAGLYYKGSVGYGGFIAPSIKTYDFAKHLSTSFPKMADRLDTDYYFVVGAN